MSSRSAGGNNPSATAPFIFLVLLICLCSSSCTGSLQSGPTKCPGSSVAIPYPFNIPSNSSKLISPGFAISCESTGPMLLLGNKSYTVLNIALDQGYVRVTGDTVYSQCHNNGTVSAKFIDLKGTPFTFSKTPTHRTSSPLLAVTPWQL